MPIVAAVDRSERSQSVLERARDLAEKYGVELHVLHVGPHPGITTIEGPFATVNEEKEAREKAFEIASEAAEFVEDYQDVEIVGLIGDPAEEILNYSREHDAEYIVTTGRKQSPLGQAVFGSVTQSLLLNADRPIVATVHRNEEE